MGASVWRGSRKCLTASFSRGLENENSGLALSTPAALLSSVPGRFGTLFLAEHCLAIIGDLVPSDREQLQCLLVCCLRQQRCEASVIASDMSTLSNETHGRIHPQPRPYPTTIKGPHGMMGTQQACDTSGGSSRCRAAELGARAFVDIANLCAHVFVGYARAGRSIQFSGPLNGRVSLPASSPPTSCRKLGAARMLSAWAAR